MGLFFNTFGQKGVGPGQFDGLMSVMEMQTIDRLFLTGVITPDSNIH